MQLRNYQIDGVMRVEQAWAKGYKNVIYVMATGGGKTVLFSSIVAQNVGGACIIAHRRELVGQISVALARQGVAHRIIGPPGMIRFVVALHIEQLGQAFYDPSASVGVASVDTLIRRADKLKNFLARVTLWVQDECHHIQTGNKWGRACGLMPHARGLGVTAEPSRADGGGLGRSQGGVFDVIIEGPTARDLIDDGWLTDYEIVCPKGDLNLDSVAVSPQTGDFSRHQLREAIRKSRIVGNVVINYLIFAPFKLGITFATDLDTAANIADEYRRAGVPAAMVGHTTPDAERQATIARFRRRDLLQLVNVDLFGEGFDLPAVEVVSMARPTESFGLYLQQFGRALRIMHNGNTGSRAERLASISASAKQKAIIIDHAGNVVRHSFPDSARPRSLERRKGRGRLRPLDETPLRVCGHCSRPFEALKTLCPYCGAPYLPDKRHAPQFVDGDLALLDVEALAILRAQVAQVDKDKEVYRGELVARHVPLIGQLAHVKRHHKRQEAQKSLRRAILAFCQQAIGQGRSARETQKLFFHTFGIDILSAQALGIDQAERLTEKCLTFGPTDGE